jgi:hypothetical protein
MQKFNFSIRTRDGLPIARLTISGRDQEEAERKLKQMYRHCEIINCTSHHQAIIKNRQNTLIKEITSLLAKREGISA